MSDKEEHKMKNKGSLTAVRNCAEVNSGFVDSFTATMQPVIQTLNERFGRMTLKGQNLRTSTGQSLDNIEDLLTPIKLLTGCDGLTTNARAKM